nr:hypothetical protein [Tanacetum cinerariifolium]
MVLTFADTHNMITYLTKSDASEGFDQIIDFLNASLIMYALTVNPNIYVSCIKQFWSSVSIKKVNDVMRLQALIDRKKVIIAEATIQEAFRLDDAESIDCLPNEEIFTELSRMGAQVSDLSSHTTKYSSPALTQKVFANMQMVGKGFSRVETPLFKGMIVAQQDDDVADEGAGGGCIQTGEIITNIDADEDVTLKDVAVVEKTAEIEENADDDELEPVELKKVVEVVTTTKLMTEVVTAASATITAATTPITAAIITAAPSATRRRKRVVIRDHEEIATPSIIIHSEPKSKHKEKGIIVEKPKPLKKQAQIEHDEAYCPKFHLVAHPIINPLKHDIPLQPRWDYDPGKLWCCSGFTKSKEQLEEEESKALKRKTKSSEEKAAKKQKLDEEVEELNKHLHIIPNNDDDVYTEATPLALKAPIVKEGFSYSKLKNFSDDYLLTTLTYMFEKPDVEPQVWKSQRGVYGLAKVKSWRLLESCGVHVITLTTTQMILLVKRRYPLTRFTLDQMLNNALNVRKLVRPLPSHHLALRYTSYHLDRFTSGSSSSHSCLDHSSSGHFSLVHSLSRHTLPDTTNADSSTPQRFVHPSLARTPRSGDSSFESSARLSRKRCRSRAITVTSSIHSTRALVHSRVDLLLPRKRFRDSISPEDSVEEDIDTNVLEDIKYEVDVGIDVEDTVEDEVKSSDRVTMEVGVDMDVGIDIPDGMLMPDAVERLEQRQLEAGQLIASEERAGLSDRTRSLERENLKEEFRQVRKDCDDTRRRLRRLESFVKRRLCHTLKRGLDGIRV